MTDNKLLTEFIVNAMHQNSKLDTSGIKVFKVQGILFLKGTVRRESEKALAEQIAFSIPGVAEVVNQLSIRENTAKTLSENDYRKTDIKLAALMKLTAIPHIAVTEPDVSVSNTTLSLYGIVDAFWKRACLEDIIKNEFPDMYVENALTVIPPGEGESLPGKHPVKEPEMFHLARAAMSQKKQAP